jgi:hypothetical protein
MGKEDSITGHKVAKPDSLLSSSDRIRFVKLDYVFFRDVDLKLKYVVTVKEGWKQQFAEGLCQHSHSLNLGSCQDRGHDFLVPRPITLFSNETSSSTIGGFLLLRPTNAKSLFHPKQMSPYRRLQTLLKCQLPLKPSLVGSELLREPELPSDS